jgi:hypothetical protein
MPARIPNPEEVATVKQFIEDASLLHVDNVEFRRHGRGLWMRCDYRDIKGFTKKRTITAPDTDDFTDLAVTMAEWLERGVTRALTDLAPRSVIMQ